MPVKIRYDTIPNVMRRRQAEPLGGGSDILKRQKRLSLYCVHDRIISYFDSMNLKGVESSSAHARPM